MIRRLFRFGRSRERIATPPPIAPIDPREQEVLDQLRRDREQQAAQS